MKTSYKIALAFCLVLLATAIAYRTLKKPAGNTDATLADGSSIPVNETDPLAVAPQPSNAPDAPIFSSNTPATTPTPTLSVAPAPLTSTPAPTPTPTAAPSPAPAPAPPPTPALPVPEVKETPKPAPKPAASGKTYTVKSGDSLTSISQKFFGDKKHADEIYNANRKTIGANPNKLKVGQKLTIPVK